MGCSSSLMIRPRKAVLIIVAKVISGHVGSGSGTWRETVSYPPAP